MTSEFINNFHFLRSWILVLLILPVLLCGAYYKMSNLQSSWQKVIDKRLLPYLLIKGSAKKRKIYALSGILVAGTT